MAANEGILFLDSDFRQEVRRSIVKCECSVEILVGFAKVGAVHWLADVVADRQLQVSLVVGWSMKDLASGSSDLLAYKEAQTRGWRFGIRPGLHAKAFWLDREELLIGSANLTPRGLHLGRIANIEAGVRVTPTNVDKVKLSQLLEQSLWLDDDLYREIEEKLERDRSGVLSENPDMDWPESIEKRLSAMERYLWVDDFFMTTPDYFQAHNDDEEPGVCHDATLLAQDLSSSNRKQIGAAMDATNAVSWLRRVLRDEPDQSAKFGRLTALLHDALLDDPKPYRSSVKQMLANLIAWIEYADLPDIHLTQYRRSQSLRLTDNGV